MTIPLRLSASLVFSLAFALPLPAATDTTLMVSSCLGGMVPVNIPGDPSAPDKSCCKGPCHSGQDRKRKDDKKDDCC